MTEAEKERAAVVHKSEWQFGREHERALIVEWLRSQNNPNYPPPDDHSRGAWNAYSGAATCLERGDHLTGRP